jgi:hypothetical protein
MASLVASRSIHYEMQRELVHATCHLSHSHMPTSVTPTLFNGVNVDAPHFYMPLLFTTRQPVFGGRAPITCIAQQSRWVCTSVWTAFSRRSLTTVGKRRNSKSLGALKEMDWRNRLVTDLAFAASEAFWQSRPIFDTPRPASANRSAKYVCALVCAKERGLLWLMSSSPVFPSLDTPTIQPSFR